MMNTHKLKRILSMRSQKLYGDLVGGGGNGGFAAPLHRAEVRSCFRFPSRGMRKGDGTKSTASRPDRSNLNGTFMVHAMCLANDQKQVENRLFVLLTVHTDDLVLPIVVNDKRGKLPTFYASRVEPF
jgi:hypothetical protein